MLASYLVFHSYSNYCESLKSFFSPKHYSFYTLLSSCTILPESLTLSLRLRVRFNICSVSFSCIPLWCLMIVSASSPSPTLRCRNCDSKISNNHMHQSSSFYIDFFLIYMYTTKFCLVAIMKPSVLFLF